MSPDNSSYSSGSLTSQCARLADSKTSCQSMSRPSPALVRCSPTRRPLDNVGPSQDAWCGIAQGPVIHQRWSQEVSVTLINPLQHGRTNPKPPPSGSPLAFVRQVMDNKSSAGLKSRSISVYRPTRRTRPQFRDNKSPLISQTHPQVRGTKLSGTQTLAPEHRLRDQSAFTGCNANPDDRFDGYETWQCGPNSTEATHDTTSRLL